MAVGKYDFEVEQGTTHHTTFVWKATHTDCCEGEEPEDPQPIDLADMELRMHIRPSAGSSTLYFEATSTNGYLPIVTPEDGIFDLRIPPEVSSAWAWRRGVYDIEVHNTITGAVQRLLEGAVTVSPEVTV